MAYYRGFFKKIYRHLSTFFIYILSWHSTKYLYLGILIIEGSFAHILTLQLRFGEGDKMRKMRRLTRLAGGFLLAVVMSIITSVACSGGGPTSPGTPGPETTLGTVTSASIFIPVEDIDRPNWVDKNIPGLLLIPSYGNRNGFRPDLEVKTMREGGRNSKVTGYLLELPEGSSYEMGNNWDIKKYECHLTVVSWQALGDDNSEGLRTTSRGLHLNGVELEPTPGRQSSKFRIRGEVVKKCEHAGL